MISAVAEVVAEDATAEVVETEADGAAATLVPPVVAAQTECKKTVSILYQKGAARNESRFSYETHLRTLIRVVIKDWRKTATELQISLKLIGSYSMRWDEL